MSKNSTVEVVTEKMNKEMEKVFGTGIDEAVIIASTEGELLKEDFMNNCGWSEDEAAKAAGNVILFDHCFLFTMNIN